MFRPLESTRAMGTNVGMDSHRWFRMLEVGECGDRQVGDGDTSVRDRPA
jgi:hypothetical protein